MCNSKELNHSIHQQTKTMNVKAIHNKYYKSISYTV